MAARKALEATEATIGPKAASEVIAIDPGFLRSAVVIYDGVLVQGHALYENAELLARLSNWSGTLVIEQIASMGMAVGEEVFETCVWSGRFWQAFSGDVQRLKRHAIKMHLCGNTRAKDANIRQALLDRFGPGRQLAMGTKKAPGKLYGIAGDEWAALAVAVTWWDLRRGLAT